MDNGTTLCKNVAGSSNGETNEEMVEVPNLRCSARRRAADDVQIPETSKRRKLGVTKEVRLNSSISKIGSTAKKSKSIDDLPPEILDAILKHVTTEHLLKCRQVNRQWNELSIRILRNRDDMELGFYCKDGYFVKGVWKSKSLTELMDGFKKSTLPCTQFNFGDLQHFGNKDVNSFLTSWGKEIFCLTIAMFDPVKTVGTMRKLLAEQVPNLKKLDIRFAQYNDHVSSPIQLFDDSTKFQLPKLETVVISGDYLKYRTISENILTSACNLKRLDLYVDISAEDLKMLQSVNKLHCLKDIRIRLSEDLINYWSKSSSSLNFKVETLHLSLTKSLENDKKHNQRATSVINQLMQSNKDIMQSLTMTPIGPLPGVVFPILKKLQQLTLNEGWTNTAMFPPLFDMAESFPNLKELVLHNVCNKTHFPSCQLFTLMPSIEMLHIHKDISAEVRRKFMKMTPNVKTLRLHDYDDSHLFEVKKFRTVVDNLKKLETFEWRICASTHHDLLFSLDAALTGLSKNFCKELSEKLQNTDDLSANELATIEQQRKHSSILDLKELKELNFEFRFDFDTYDQLYNDCDNEYCVGDCGCGADEGGYGPYSKFYKTGITKVSEFLGFQLMPNLKIKINRKVLIEH